MTPWTRMDTQYWISQLETRIEDIEFYLNRTTEWCNDREINNPHAVMACMIITVLWVSHMRKELVSKREIFELVGVRDWYTAPEEEYFLSDEYGDMDIDELLDIAASTWG